MGVGGRIKAIVKSRERFEWLNKVKDSVNIGLGLLGGP